MKRGEFLKGLGLAASEHSIAVDMAELRLVTANYLYQLDMMNRSGTARDVKMMTAAHQRSRAAQRFPSPVKAFGRSPFFVGERKRSVFRRR